MVKRRLRRGFGLSFPICGGIREQRAATSSARPLNTYERYGSKRSSVAKALWASIHGRPDGLTLDSVGCCCSINRTAPFNADTSNGGNDAEGETLARG